MKMRFRTRAFLICFVPFALVLTGSFWMIQRLVESTVRNGLRQSLREKQAAVAKVHEKGGLQNSRFLKVAGENPALKAGMQLLDSVPGNDGARRTVEDQLRELGEHMGFDYLAVSNMAGENIAGVARSPGGLGHGNQLAPVATASLPQVGEGLHLVDGTLLQIASIPVDQDERNMGTLSVGEYFDFSEFTSPVVLLHSGKVIRSNIAELTTGEIQSSLQRCSTDAECEVRLGGANWISAPMQKFNDGYELRSLENADKAIAPVQANLHRLFLAVALFSVLVGLISSIIASRSIVGPISAVVANLNKAGKTGALPEFHGKPPSIAEVRALVETYNRAALSVRKAGAELQAAYLEFVGSLANALDARDGYTAGHSWRVSQLSCAVAAAIHLPEEEIQKIRIGALLHDIGKIGIADAVLQKPGRLDDEEFALVKQHPVIGRRILEGVQGFATFLDAVELHHENWDGSGYPKGQKGTETPVEARIIHVADAYDAMTTNRSYRRGLAHSRAVEILQEYAGVQFDPAIVEAFATIAKEMPETRPAPLDDHREETGLVPAATYGTLSAAQVRG